jgi:hypothetical protein
MTVRISFFRHAAITFNKFVIPQKTLIHGTVKIAPVTLLEMISHKKLISSLNGRSPPRKQTQNKTPVCQTESVPRDIRPIAAPGVFRRIFHNAGTNRIQMNIRRQLQEVTVFVTEDCFIPALKEMTHQGVFPIISSCISELKHLHDAGQGYFTDLNEQVDMIDHQHVRVEAKVKTFFVFSDISQIKIVVLVITKDFLSPVPSRNHVIQSTWKMHSWFSGHGFTSSTKTTENKYSIIQA